MKEDFDYNQVPGNYIHCLHAQCHRSANCLRYLITRHVPQKIKSISVINPTHILDKEDVCPYFHEDRLACFALGITHLFDNLTYKRAIQMRKLLYAHLRRNTFYRIQRKERLIHPSELSLIREIFRNEGIKEEPAFDKLIYKYDWLSEN